MTSQLLIVVVKYRMDYTVIGGDVNLSARLESLTKEHGAPIIVSERTFQLLAGEGLALELTEIGRVPVRGIAEPVGIYGWRQPS